MEFELLAHLVANQRRVYTRGQLMALVWQQTATGDMRTVDVHIARLRQKLGPGHRTPGTDPHRTADRLRLRAAGHDQAPPLMKGRWTSGSLVFLALSFQGIPS
ncbi:helix-turn-helix domain-containing protein [Streptomyces yunnanensis]|uniref:Helix-turn-helix domain-containing protein n=1 Tax=Streptomyces yunnanensis TaxID=156453 RepID=A0ABY8AFT0_9ACTN|nr:helix-turn-helix domain-containing protein [Streptomyces yunnanensis]WEB43609.1 helix-turn-helix domain-containing protein [Streptomyces yunnanensis]